MKALRRARDSRLSCTSWAACTRARMCVRVCVRVCVHVCVCVCVCVCVWVGGRGGVWSGGSVILQWFGRLLVRAEEVPAFELK
jgi:hypothetical protein